MAIHNWLGESKKNEKAVKVIALMKFKILKKKPRRICTPDLCALVRVRVHVVRVSVLVCMCLLFALGKYDVLVYASVSTCLRVCVSGYLRVRACMHFKQGYIEK